MTRHPQNKQERLKILAKKTAYQKEGEDRRVRRLLKEELKAKDAEHELLQYKGS